jgi:tetratricopeptide (TPR) repeat protein
MASGMMLSAALSSAAASLGPDPSAAATEAQNILAALPGQQQALLLFVGALRLRGDLASTRTILETMVETNPGLAAPRYELGLLLGTLGLHREAIAQFSKVVEFEPNHPSAWRALGNELAAAGDTVAAAKAFGRQMKSSLRELKMLEDAAGGSEEDVARAENMLRQSVALNPTDMMTIRMLAQRELWLGHNREAERLLENALRLVPDFVPARQEFAFVLQQEMRWREAMAQLDIILHAGPENVLCESLKAWNLIMLGEYNEAFQLFDRVRPELEDSAAHWVNYGHALRTVGRSAEAIQAYRKVLELEPGFGLTWWSLANLKTYRFSAADIEIMRTQLKREGLTNENRCHLEFALGSALEAERAYAESFAHYHEGNLLRRPRLSHDPAEVADRVSRSKALFTREIFRARAGLGCLAPDPIFIVGMPRAGSTLVEQILSSHSAIEGTAELPDLLSIVSELGRLSERTGYPGILAELDTAALKARGEQYLELTRYQRKLGRPLFTDKAPQNFQHVGLIQLILPNAKIIDARRHPMACSFSGYKQCFQMGSMPHTYDLTEVGLFYRNYVELMAHYDRVLPGRVHRVFHENMVRDPEAEIRRLLEYCGLAFEESCLRFYETERGVRTSSSEQVRRPIFAPAVEPWRNYEPWLGPMKAALGDVLDFYPAVPEF